MQYLATDGPSIEGGAEEGGQAADDEDGPVVVQDPTNLIAF